LKVVWKWHWICEFITDSYYAAENGQRINTNSVDRLPVEVAQQAKRVRQFAG